MGDGREGGTAAPIAMTEGPTNPIPTPRPAATSAREPSPEPRTGRPTPAHPPRPPRLRPRSRFGLLAAVAAALVAAVLQQPVHTRLWERVVVHVDDDNFDQALLPVAAAFNSFPHPPSCLIEVAHSRSPKGAGNCVRGCGAAVVGGGGAARWCRR